MKIPLAHAGSAWKCTDGKHLVFNTLCGMNAQATAISLAISPDMVNCKACLKSRAWEAYLDNVKARQE